MEKKKKREAIIQMVLSSIAQSFKRLLSSRQDRRFPSNIYFSSSSTVDDVTIRISFGFLQTLA